MAFGFKIGERKKIRVEGKNDNSCRKYSNVAWSSPVDSCLDWIRWANSVGSQAIRGCPHGWLKRTCFTRLHSSSSTPWWRPPSRPASSPQSNSRRRPTLRHGCSTYPESPSCSWNHHSIKHRPQLVWALGSHLGQSVSRADAAPGRAETQVKPGQIPNPRRALLFMSCRRRWEFSMIRTGSCQRILQSWPDVWMISQI